MIHAALGSWPRDITDTRQVDLEHPYTFPYDKDRVDPDSACSGSIHVYDAVLGPETYVHTCAWA